MTINWLPLGTKPVTDNWVLFDQSVVTVEVFRITHFYNDRPPYGAKAAIAQFFSGSTDPLISKYVYPTKDEERVIEIAIPNYLKQLNSYTRYLGIKISSFGYANNYFSDWSIQIEEYNGSG